MQTWQQLYSPLGSLGVSALAAVIPIVFFFLALAVFRLKGHVAGSITLALSIAVAIFAFHMPVDMAFAAAGYGFAYGLWPIAWIIVAAVFLYKLTVKSGQFEVIRSSVLSITDDQRLQVLLIGFCWSVPGRCRRFRCARGDYCRVAGRTGLQPLYAAGLCLIANTAPVAFGALGIPIIVAGQVTGIDAFKIGAMTGRQLPLLSLFVPFWLVFMMDGLRGVRETWPAALVAGLSFAITQYFTSNFIGPELPDITSALASLISLTLFLKIWQPKRTAGAQIAGATSSAAITASVGGFGQKRTTVASPYSLGEIFKAWSPFLILTVLVTIWTLKPFKAMFAAGGSMYSWVFNFAIPHLDQLVIKTAPIVATPTAIPAVFKLDPISATGTAIFFSALISMLVLKINFKTGLTTLKETFYELRWPILSIGMVLAFAFVTNYSGMSSTMALVLAGTGAAFPFFSPFLGWLGVFLTGSDTSSNALFSSLQATTAHQIGVNDTLLVAANTSGGVTGKMISPQSIAVACAATGLVGKESDLFRFTLKHSLFFATIVGLITLAQAYWFTGMLVH